MLCSNDKPQENVAEQNWAQNWSWQHSVCFLLFLGCLTQSWMLQLNLPLQQEKQELSCDSEAATTDLSLAQPLPKGTLEWKVCSSRTEGWGLLHLHKVEPAAVYSYLHQGGLERELGQIPEVLGAAIVLPSHRSHPRDVPMWNSFRGSPICRAPAAAHGVASTITDTQIQLEMCWEIIKIIQDHQVQLLIYHCQDPLNTMHTSATVNYLHNNRKGGSLTE